MPMPTDPVSRVTLADEAYLRIEAAILDGTLEPSERLRDQDLAHWLGISRTPIRHALDRLMNQGLVEMERNRYTRVAPFDPSGVRGAVEVAGDLWSGAVRRGLTSWAPDDVDDVIAIATGLAAAARVAGLPTFVRSFEHLVTTCVLLEGNPARQRTLANVLPQVHRLGRKLNAAGTLDYDRLRVFADDFIAAVRERDSELASGRIGSYVAKLSASVPVA